MNKKSRTMECAMEGCGNKFEKKTSWHIYCSRRCKQIAWHISKAEQLISEGQPKVAR